MLLISSNKPLPIHSVHWGISVKPPLKSENCPSPLF